MSQSWQGEQMGCKQQPQPGREVACINNCGFFGNDTTMNMCPNCYRAYLSSHADSSSPAPTPSAKLPPTSDGTVPLSVHLSSTADMSQTDASNGSSTIPCLPSQAGADRSLLERTSILDSSAAVEARARFPRVQSATETDSRINPGAAVSSQAPGGGGDPFLEVLAPAKVEIPADSLIRTNASRALDVDMAAVAVPVVAPLLPKLPAAVSSLPLKVPTAGASKPNRCEVCRKKVGLTGFKCRCKGLFCGTHRYSDKHNCSFDYKAAGREAIARANPIVKADKVVRF